jgi:ubiquinone/menaquinone biosynthesis C-methylase UbiE
MSETKKDKIKFRQILKNIRLATLVKLIYWLKLPIPLSEKTKWKAGINTELTFWDSWLKTKGGSSHKDFLHRLDPSSNLQDELCELLPVKTNVHILDVGAGPLTLLGKTCNGKNLTITAVDTLANEYNKLLEKYQISPLVRTLEMDAEHLSENFKKNTFDLVCAINSIDHVYDPEEAILQMLFIVKNGSYVFLRHTANEAKNQNYTGLHQWNFSMSRDGDFIISSKTKQINMTNKYSDICNISCERIILLGKEKIVTRIRKR